jgi:hypothetical protein
MTTPDNPGGLLAGMNWQIIDPGGQSMTVTEEQLRALLRSGHLKRSTLMWAEGMADWTPADIARPDLFPAFCHLLAAEHYDWAAHPSGSSSAPLIHLNQVDRIYLKLLLIGSIRIRNLCDLGLYDEVRAEAEHLHHLPTLIGDPVCHSHYFYLRTHRHRFLEAMKSKGTMESLRQVGTTYEGLWKQLEAAVREVHGEEPPE